MVDRAKQFLPFDALKGFSAALREKERNVVERKDILDDEINLLNQKILLLHCGMIVEAIYYCKDEYLKVCGLISKVNFLEKYFVIVKTKIYFKDLYSLQSEEFIDLF